MSIAMKCDRCKKCFDPMDIENPEYFATIEQIFYQDGEEWNDRKIGYNEKNINMCPGCTAAFVKFWEEGEREEAKPDEGTETADISVDDGLDRVGNYIDRFRSAIRKLDDLCNSFGSNKAPERESGTEKKSDG